MFNGQRKIWEITKQEFDNVIDINIKGTANVLRHFIPLMIPKNQGIIVNVSSILATMGVATVRISTKFKRKIVFFC